jgi:hypothetical protein
VATRNLFPPFFVPAYFFRNFRHSTNPIMKTKTYSPLSWACNLSAFALSFLVIHHAAANSFTSTGSMTVPRAWVDSVLLLNGKVLAVGGYDGVNYQSSAELYDPATGTWTATGALPAPGGPYTTLLPNGKVLVAGGFGSGNVAELYDPATGVWTPTGSMNRSRSAPVTLLPNGKVLVAGGSIGDKTAELYDSATGLWTPTGSMNVGRSEFIACLLPNGKVLAAGGNGNGANLSSAELYDPATGEWTLTGSMNSSRRNGANTMLPNGKFFICGGIGNSGDLAAAELYDPTTGVWTQTGSMSHIRNGHLVTLLPNGDVLVVGGYYKQASAELYSPGTGTWRAAAAPHIGREVHIQKLLPSGAVLVAGGRDAGTSAELYFSQAASTCTPTPSGTVAWWPGEGTAQDIIGTNNSTLMNGATYLQVGKVGQAFSFDGVDDYVSAPQTALSNILNNFTMEFWVYPTAGRSVTPESNSGVHGAGGQRYAIFPYFSTVSDTGAGASVGTNGISIFEHGSYHLPSPLVYQGAITGWTHVAVVYTNKQPSLYVNGVWVRTGLASAQSSIHPSPGLGGYNWYGYYAGLLDEVSIYDRALAPTEIASIYAAGSAGKCLVVSPPARNPVIGWPANGLGMTNMPANLTNAVKIAAGVYHSLALKADGTVVGWGENDFGQTISPAGLTNVTAIAAGWGTSLALKQDGTLAEWGWYGLKSTAETLTNITAVSACWDCLMALTSDGTVLVWGKSTHGETNLPSGLTGITAIAGGGFHCLALKSDGTIAAWGDNSEGQLNVPAGLTGVVGIAAGGYHSLALRQDGTVVVWGKNSSGQTNVPPNLLEVVAISGGYYHSLALRGDGSIIAWGDNSSGQTNVPANLTNVVAIAAGGYHNLALTGTRAPWTKFTHMSCAANGQVRFTVSGLCGDVYQILGSTNLQHWQILGTITNVSGAVKFIDPSATNYTQRFYRLVMP